MSALEYLTRLAVALILLQSTNAQTVSFTDSTGATLPTTYDESSTAYSVCINLSEAPTGSDMEITLGIMEFPGSAVRGEDFTISQTMFTFAVGTGELRQCFDITIPVDNLLEQQEFFSLMAGTASATFIINDAEVLQVGLEMSNYAVNEEGNNLQVCVVTLPGPTFADNANNINLEIDVATAGDTATVIEDFTGPSQSSVTLNSANPTACIMITPESDTMVEGTETLTVTITPQNNRAAVVDGRGMATVSIEDDEAATVEFQQASASVAEGDSGMMANVQLCLELTLTPGSTLARDVEAEVTISGGTASSGEDFTFATNTATFGVSSVTGDVQCLDVTVIGDSDYESDETVTFDLSATRTGQAGSANTFTLTITNDDAAPTTSPPTTMVAPSPSTETGGLSNNQSRNIGIGVGVGVGGFLLVLFIVLVIVIVVVTRSKKNSEKYVLNYSTVYGSSPGSTGTSNDYSSTPQSQPADGGESASNGVNERPVDVGDDASDESEQITFKEE